jgi:mono/diheme cytochrome c family protein
MRYFACWVTLVLASVTIAGAHEAKTEVKHEAAAQTSPASGKEMFLNYCAACHGKDGKGNGPTAPGLKAAPDLTVLASSMGASLLLSLPTSNPGSGASILL